MLETIREYALERLAESGEAETPGAAARRALPGAGGGGRAATVTGPEQGAWLDRLEAEHDNLRAALRWFSDRDRAEQGLQLGGALGSLWSLHGYLTEGRAGSLSCWQFRLHWYPRQCELVRLFCG